MQRRLSINLDCVKNVDPLRALDSVKSAGFDGFFTGPHLTDSKQMDSIANKANALGLHFEFIHAPYHGVNAMWQESEQTQLFMQSFFHAVDNAKLSGVSLVILHSSSTWSPPLMTEAGFQRFDTLVEYAEKNGVKVAIENLRVAAYYEALLQRDQDKPFVGFCYDCGHEHWCNPTLPHIQRYAEKLFCTHLHDNLGQLENYLTISGDLHLMPFDGNFDFKGMMQQLNAVNYAGALTLELKSYETQDPDTFFKTAFDRLKTLSQF